MNETTLKNFLEKNKYKIKNEKEFLELVSLIAKEKESYLFRGQANSEWKLESSFFRIYKTSKKSVLYLFKIRIDSIKEKYFEKDDLTLASKMQHSKIETILIDFTSNFYHALWFAFSPLGKNVINKEQKKLKYRSLYLLKNNEKIIYEIKTRKSKKENNLEENNLEDNWLKENQIIEKGWEEKNKIYKCPLNNKRGISQKSYFIIDNQDWNEKNIDTIIKIDINNNLLEKILNFLTKKGISGSTIFPDLEGLKLEFESFSKKWKAWKSNYLL